MSFFNYVKVRKVASRANGDVEVCEFDTFKAVRHGVVAVVALIVLSICWPFASVPTGSRGVITQFGRITGIEQEGLAILWPWQKLSIFSVRAETATVNNATGATADTQPVDVDLTVRYSVLPDKVAEVFEKYSHDGDLSSYVQTAVQESFKAVTARYVATDLIAKRAVVSADVRETLQAKLALYGAQVINIDMQKFEFQKAYMEAINDKVTQEQKRLAADNKLKTVESEQKQKVAVAEAEASAVKARADGDAYAQLKIATAQAESLRIQNSALRENKDVLELRRIEVSMEQAKRWNGALPQNIYAGAPIPFLNVTK